MPYEDPISFSDIIFDSSLYGFPTSSPPSIKNLDLVLMRPLS